MLAASPSTLRPESAWPPPSAALPARCPDPSRRHADPGPAHPPLCQPQSFTLRGCWFRGSGGRQGGLGDAQGGGRAMAAGRRGEHRWGRAWVGTWASGAADGVETNPRAEAPPARPADPPDAVIAAVTVPRGPRSGPAPPPEGASPPSPRPAALPATHAPLGPRPGREGHRLHGSHAGFN